MAGHETENNGSEGIARGTPATPATPPREGATAACRPCAQLTVALCLVRSEPLYVLDSARPGASGYDAIC